MRQRPISVTIFAVFVLFLTAWNGVRFFAAISSWAFLLQLPGKPGVSYILISALTWISVGLLIFRGTWLGREWIPMAGWCYVLLYILTFWVDRLLFRPLELGQDILFVIMLQITALCITAWALSAPAGRSFFKQRQQNDGTI
jgi:hypothetical protein